MPLLIPWWSLGCALMALALLLPLQTAGNNDSVMSVVTKEVTMPMLSTTMTEGTVSTWLKKVGDKIDTGTILLTVESDKAEMDVESFEEGYLAKIVVPAGNTAKVGEVIALLVESKNMIDVVSMATDAIQNAGMQLPVGREISVPRDVAPAPESTDKPPLVTVEGSKGPEVSQPENVAQVGQRTSWQPFTQMGGQQQTKLNEHLPFVPSGMDQDIKDNLPPGLTPQKLSEKLFDAVENSPNLKAQLRRLEAAPGGKEFVAKLHSRAAVRAPPLQILNSYGSQPAPATAHVNNEETIFQIAHKAAEILEARGWRPTVTGATKPVGGNPWIVGQSTSKEQQKIESVSTPAADLNSVLLVSSTPQARRLAQSASIDLSKIRGTGNFGRITLQDVKNHISSAGRRPAVVPTPNAPTSNSMQTIRPLSAVQKSIAKNMADTVNTPVFRLSRSIRSDNLNDVYRSVKARGVTWSSLLAKAIALVLSNPEHSLINSVYDPVNAAVIHPSRVNIAMAVAPRDGGLLTPVLFDAGNLDVFSLSSKWAELVKKANNKQITPSECTGGTFYVSNLGQYGVHQFDAILPKGAGAILSVGDATLQLAPAKDGTNVVGLHKEMIVTLTCDHRHINGVDAGRFLQALTGLIENRPKDLLA